MRKYLAVLLTLILVFSSNAGAFAQGQVNVRHYDVSEFNEYPDTDDSDAQKWATESLDTEDGDIVIKNAAYGTDNWSGNAGEDAFLRDQSGTSKNAQKIFGYIAPTEDVENMTVTVDDGLRLYIDLNENGVIEYENELVIDKYFHQSAKAYTANFNSSLLAGKDYKFEIHYFNWGGEGALEFKANNSEMDLDWFRIDERKDRISLENEEATDFFYINDDDQNIYKYFPAVDALEAFGDSNNVYYDIANKNNELYGARNSKLYKLDSESTSEKTLNSAHHINSLTHNNGYFFYVADQNLYAYDEANDEIIHLVDTDYTSAGDLVALNQALYFTTTNNKLVKIDFDNFSVSDEKTYSGISDIFGLANFNGSLYIGHSDNKISSLNANFEIVDTFEVPVNGTIFGMAQGSTANAPQVSNVQIELDGTVVTEGKIGDELKGTYDFSDAEDDSDNSQFKWYVDGVENDNTTDTLVITEDMVNKTIEFEVTARADKEPKVGNSEKSSALRVLEPNLYITVDDGYVLYFNGEKIGEDPSNWQSVDSYYVDSVPASQANISVKGYDKDNGTAKISGFTLAYRTSDNQWIKSDDTWEIYKENEPESYTFNGTTYQWFQNGYKANDWLSAHRINVLDPQWPKDNEKLNAAAADWIWSDQYQTVDVNPFDSPVYFRNTLLEESYYDHGKTTLSVDPNSVTDGDPSTATVQIFDQYGEAIDDSNYSVVFFDDAIQITEDIAYVNDGKYEVTFIPAYGEENKITATVNGQDVDDFETIRVDKKVTDLLLDLTLTPVTVNEGESVEASVTVKDGYGDFISGLDVVLEGNNQVIGTMNDDSNGNYSLNFVPDQRGENEIMASVGNASDEESVEVIPVIEDRNDLEFDITTEISKVLENTYQRLVLLAQMRTRVPDAVGNLRNNILKGQNKQDLINEDYSLEDDSFRTFAETIDGVKDFESINYLATEAGVLKDKDNKIIGYMDDVIIDQYDDSGESKSDIPEWHTIAYNGNFTNPVVIAQLSSLTGPNYTHIRVKNVTSNSFDIFLEEWSTHRSTNHHNHELVSYIVLEAGNYELQDGTLIEAALIDNLENQQEMTYEYNKHYEKPVVFSQSQSYEDPSQLWMRQDNINEQSVDLIKQGEQNAHGEKQVGVVVLAKALGQYPPEAMDDIVEVDEDKSILIDVLANDSDLNNDPLTILSISNPPENGTVVIESEKIEYTPEENFNGDDTFGYIVSDGQGNTDEAEVTVTVKPVNDGPNVQDDSITTTEDQAVSFTPVADDIDDDSLTFTIQTQGDKGTAVVNNDGSITYTPNENENGNDSFVILVDDGNGGTDTATIDVTITPVNDGPVMPDQNFNVDEDAVLNENILFSDPEDDAVTLDVLTGPKDGVLTINNTTGAFTYTPNANFNGDDSLIVKAVDENGAETTAIITITVNPINDAPIINDQEFTTDEDISITEKFDVEDDSDWLDLTIDTTVENGSLLINGDEFTYTPDSHFNGVDTFTVTVEDSEGLKDTATVTINVTPVNDAPTITEETLVTDEDTPITDTFEVNDVDGDTLEISIVNNPSNGTLELDEIFGFTYTPNADFSGEDTFEVKVSDGLLESTGIMTINVVSVEDTPLAVDDQVSTDENQRKTIDVLGNDLIGDSETLEITKTTAPSKGSISITEDHEIIYTPRRNEVGNDSFTYEVTGGSTATVSIIINPVDDDDNDDDGGNTGGGGFTPSNDDSINAVTDNLTTIVNQPVVTDVDELLANDEDADEITSVENGGNGTVSISGDEITFTPTEGFIGRAYYYYTAENDADESDRGTVIVTVEEGTVIEPTETPLGGGNKDEMILINPELVPLGTIDFSDPYIYGYPDDTFRPERPVTRAEIATIVARILKLDLMNTGEAIYNDVNASDWFYNYIQAVTHLEIFNGYGDGTFKPNQPVTHGEMAAIFSKYWELKNIELPSEEVPYKDVEGHWAEDHISRFYNAGVSVGFIDETFRPNAFTKRSELVVMVNRIIDRPNLEQETPSFTDVSKEFWGYEAIEAATEGFVPLEQ